MSVTTESPAATAAITSASNAVSVSSSDPINASQIRPGAKKLLVASRIASGLTKQQALAEFELAKSQFHSNNKTLLASATAQDFMRVGALHAKVNKTTGQVTGFSVSVHDTRVDKGGKVTVKQQLANTKAELAAMQAELAKLRAAQAAAV
jgi:hypothetical protein